jgi:hypothetical protein
MPQLVSPRLASQLQRRTAAHAYTDTAYYTPEADLTSLDEYGQPTASTSRVPVSCSFTDKPKIENWRGDADVESVEAEIRFTTPAPDKGGRITIARRFGQPVAERTFEIIGIQDRGTFGYVCALRAVTL